MAWLSTHDSTNLITDESRTWEHYLSYYFGSGDPINKVRTITETQARYVGMTEAAADLCVTDLADDGDKEDIVKRNTGGGSFEVSYVQRTVGAWGDA